MIPPKLESKKARNAQSEQDPYSSNTAGKPVNSKNPAASISAKYGGRGKSRDFSLDDRDKEQEKEAKAKRSLQLLDKEINRMPQFSLKNPPPELDKETEVSDKEDQDYAAEDTKNSSSFKKQQSNLESSPQKSTSKDKGDQAPASAAQVNAENV